VGESVIRVSILKKGNMSMNIKEKISAKWIMDFVMLTLGAIIAAFAIEEFLVPNTILDGGVIGIGIMISSLTKLPLSVLTIVFNVPFLIIGVRQLGKMFIIKSGYAMIVFSLFVEIFAPMVNATAETILAVCFGGVILGTGVGIIIRFGGCLDGTETVAIILNRKKNLPVGQAVLAMNLVIYSAAGLIFGWDRAMYSLLTYFITSKVLDIIESGLDQAKAAMIITDDAQEVADKIYKQLGRTVTVMQGKGMISGQKSVVYCVLTRFEIRELKSIINSIDSSAFVTVSDVSEIIGNHIKSTDYVEVEEVKN
jgi:uncharacterized membrane-anchored protein YitT (DUF2179 family)